MSAAEYTRIPTTETPVCSYKRNHYSEVYNASAPGNSYTKCRKHNHYTYQHCHLSISELPMLATARECLDALKEIERCREVAYDGFVAKHVQGWADHYSLPDKHDGELCLAIMVRIHHLETPRPPEH